MKTGPKVRSGFDLALTEIVHSSEHRFLVEIGSELGIELVDELNLEVAPQEDWDLATTLSNQARDSMGREINTEGIKELLQRNLENPRWEELASRCLSCANCTMVCPTCFCSTTEDITDLTGDHAERWRRWDSCFTADFTHLPEGSVRSTTGARYRQWMTHKLANWFDQFGTSGCVGCGRCVTWCPVGIDITEEVAAIQASEIEGKAS
jgi:sulfhydrogenase subunit beta (sulfur reductase)